MKIQTIDKPIDKSLLFSAFVIIIENNNKNIKIQNKIFYVLSNFSFLIDRHECQTVH